MDTLATLATPVLTWLSWLLGASIKTHMLNDKLQSMTIIDALLYYVYYLIVFGSDLDLRFF